MSGVLKLLILLTEKNDKNTEFTQLRYTPGTRKAWIRCRHIQQEIVLPLCW